MTKEYIGREEKCGDCIHVEICERNPILTEFSRENPAYCKKIMKAADVVEVRHGRWVHNEDYEDWAEKYVCSECNRNAPSDGDYRHSLTDYCPHCGAKMDKEE